MARRAPQPVLEARAIADGFRAAGVDLTIRSLVEHHIDAVLRTVGNTKIACELLGMNRRSLQRRRARRARARKAAARGKR